MHGPQKTEISSTQLSLGAAGQKVMLIGGVVGLICLAAAFGIAYSGAEAGDHSQMYNAYQNFGSSYLVAFCMFMTISIGALFFVTIHHLTRAGWGVTVRRIAEVLAMCSMPMLFFFLPILVPLAFENDAIYMWNNTALSDVNHDDFDELISHKAAYLQPGFFIVRTLAFFGVWVGMSTFFFRKSLAQDKSGDKKLTLKMQAFAAPAMILFAVSLVFSSFDWEMSLEPKWFSTILPVYFFAGGFLASLATLIIIIYLLQASGRLTEDITPDHYHDLAKLAFGFIFFWGYIAFSQYLLIWYANLPEETFWYGERQEFGWGAFSMVLLFGHLLIPFLAMMARTCRRNKNYLFGASIYLLVMHWVDHYWLIMPVFHKHFSMPGAVDILCVVGMLGVFASMFCFIAGDRPLIPLKDPRLVESLNFENV